ncbi:MAG: polysaccharide biosynthesis/export family protein [Bacteroidales bacterium]|nr:polysaccharide biosynthesis/export family protein [Candidatus Equibacterium intestinale]
MKHIKLLVLTFVVAAAAAGCASPKKILYFQDINQAQLQKLTTAYQAVIKKDDKLTIVVTGPDKTVVAPYNLTLSDPSQGAGGSYNPEQSTLGYLVDAYGDIQFPILGKIHVEGMTRNQLAEYLTEEIGKDVKDPIVYVAFRNYKITVLGEVRNPGTYTMESEKVNILQAISRAGDLNLTAEREGIILLREEKGRIEHYEVDLKSSHLLDSPYFFLQQNDILYIPPSPGRVATATNSLGVWTTALSSVTSVLAIASAIISLTVSKKQ